MKFEYTFIIRDKHRNKKLTEEEKKKIRDTIDRQSKKKNFFCFNTQVKELKFEKINLIEFKNNINIILENIGDYEIENVKLNKAKLTFISYKEIEDKIIHDIATKISQIDFTLNDIKFDIKKEEYKSKILEELGCEELGYNIDMKFVLEDKYEINRKNLKYGVILCNTGETDGFLHAASDSEIVYIGEYYINKDSYRDIHTYRSYNYDRYEYDTYSSFGKNSTLVSITNEIEFGENGMFFQVREDVISLDTLKSGKYIERYRPILKNITNKNKQHNYIKIGEKEYFFYKGDLKYKAILEKDDNSWIYTYSCTPTNGVGCLYNSFNSENKVYKLYEGGFKNGKYHGEGVLYNPENLYDKEEIYEDERIFDRYTIKSPRVIYKGGFYGGLYDGQGISYYDSGEIEYVGGWDAGKKSGKGTLYGKNSNIIYTGEWENGYYNGKGTLFDEKEELKYSGDFINGMTQDEYNSIDWEEIEYEREVNGYYDDI